MKPSAFVIPQKTPPPSDRPGWIPPHILRDWNPNPYAYQTEEETMPAGGLHGQLLAYLMELLRHFLDQQGLMLLLDTFLLYRDTNRTQQRIAPDLLLMPMRFPPPTAYDLGSELPPILVIEVTSPKSHLKDLQTNVAFYHRLGIRAYLVIDAITPRAQLRDPIEIHLWRETNGVMEKVKPDRRGALALPEMGVLIFTRQDHIRLVDMGTGNPLRDMEGEQQVRRAAERRALTAEHQVAAAQHQVAAAEHQVAAAEQQVAAAEEKATQATRQVKTEQQARLQAEARLRELEEKLKKAGLE